MGRAGDFLGEFPKLENHSGRVGTRIQGYEGLNLSDLELNSRPNVCLRASRLLDQRFEFRAAARNPEQFPFRTFEFGTETSERHLVQLNLGTENGDIPRSGRALGYFWVYLILNLPKGSPLGIEDQEPTAPNRLVCVQN